MKLGRFGILWCFLLAAGVANRAAALELNDSDASGPNCGINSVYTALRCQGVKLDFSSLLQPQYVGSSSGSSIPELLLAVHDHDGQTQVLTNLSVADLRNLPGPAILHVRNNADAAEYNHFILCTPLNGRLAFYDPPGQVSRSWGHELASIWDGTAVVVSAGPINLNPLRAWAAARTLAIILLVIGAIGAVKLLQQMYQRRVTARSIEIGHMTMRPFGMRSMTARAPWMRWPIEWSALMGITMLIALAYHFLSPEGFFAQRGAIVSMSNARFSDPLVQVDLGQARQLHLEHALFVDARRVADYDQAHIAGAINIPPDAISAGIEGWLGGQSHDAKLVVYCQSPSCPFAAQLAKRLKQHGFDQVRVFTGGWEQWHPADETMIDPGLSSNLSVESGS